jgi:hypothetical protein
MISEPLRHFCSVALKTANRVCSGLDSLALSHGTDQLEPVFVVGLPRSGTTLVYELVVDAFETAYLTEIYNYTFGLPNLTARLNKKIASHPSPQYESNYGRIPGLFAPAESDKLWRRWLPQDPVFGHYMPPGILEQTTTQAMKRVVSSMTAIAGKQYIFKNVYFSLSFDLLLDVFPNGRIVVVQRDLEAVAASVYRRRREMGTARRWWSLMPPFSAELAGQDLLEQVAFQCVRSQQLMEQAFRRCPQRRCFSIDYEELCREPSSFLSRLAGWLGPAFPKRYGSATPQRFDCRASVGFPDGLGERFRDCVTRLNNSRDSYLNRVAEEERRRSGSRRVAGG